MKPSSTDQSNPRSGSSPKRQALKQTRAIECCRDPAILWSIAAHPIDFTTPENTEGHYKADIMITL